MSRAVRSYFSAEQVAPIEEYREGEQIWHFAGTAQSFQFDLLDHETRPGRSRSASCSA